MSYIYFFAGVVFAFFLIEMAKAIIIINVFKRTERALLIMSIGLLEYKYQAVSLMQIVYDRAAEQDQKYAEEGKLVINKIHEKFNSFGNDWIKYIKSTIPYETKYNNWQEAIEYIQRLITKEKKA